jgi:hypothetical protein
MRCAEMSMSWNWNVHAWKRRRWTVRGPQVFKKREEIVVHLLSPSLKFSPSSRCELEPRNETLNVIETPIQNVHLTLVLPLTPRRARVISDVFYSKGEVKRGTSKRLFRKMLAYFTNYNWGKYMTNVSMVTSTSSTPWQVPSVGLWLCTQ